MHPVNGIGCPDITSLGRNDKSLTPPKYYMKI